MIQRALRRPSQLETDWHSTYRVLNTWRVDEPMHSHGELFSLPLNLNPAASPIRCLIIGLFPVNDQHLPRLTTV